MPDGYGSGGKREDVPFLAIDTPRGAPSALDTRVVKTRSLKQGAGQIADETNVRGILVSGDLPATWTTYLDLTSGNLKLTGTLVVGGATTLTDTLTISGARPITLSATSGSVSIKGSDTGWADGYFFTGSSDAALGGFGALGSSDTLTNFWVGSAYNGSDGTVLVPGTAFSPQSTGGLTLGTSALKWGKLFLSASVTGAASVSVPHGTAPTSPVNGDVWTTTAGLYVRVNGSTIGPLS